MLTHKEQTCQFAVTIFHHKLMLHQTMRNDLGLVFGKIHLFVFRWRVRGED